MEPPLWWVGMRGDYALRLDDEFDYGMSISMGI
jgi:hypothetical protein